MGYLCCVSVNLPLIPRKKFLCEEQSFQMAWALEQQEDFVRLVLLLFCNATHILFYDGIEDSALERSTDLLPMQWKLCRELGSYVENFNGMSDQISKASVWLFFRDPWKKNCTILFLIWLRWGLRVVTILCFERRKIRIVMMARARRM